jgi:NUC153 domain
LNDDRYKQLFTREDFAIDKTNPEYLRHHPNEYSKKGKVEETLQENEEQSLPKKSRKEDNAIRIFKNQVNNRIKKKHWKYNKTENLQKRVAISAKSIIKPSKRFKRNSGTPNF